MRASSIAWMFLSLALGCPAIQAQQLGLYDSNLAPAGFIPPLPSLPASPAILQPAFPAGSVELASATFDVTSDLVSPPAADESIPTATFMNYGRTYVQVDGLFWHRAGSGCSDVVALNTG